MLEFSTLGTFIELYQKISSVFDKRKENKRKFFLEMVEPVHKELETVVKEYYEFFRVCRDEFSNAPSENLSKILGERRKKREEIVLARNKVVGIADAFNVSIQTRKTSKKNEKETALIYRYVTRIRDMFYVSIESTPSVASNLFDEIELLIYFDNTQLIVIRIEECLHNMEARWLEISSTYGELRIFYLS